MGGPYKKLKINGKTVYEHREIVARREGRTLGRFEFVHHDNHVKTDNAPSNLVLTTPCEHSRHHMLKHAVEKACVICGTVFAPAPSHRPRDLTCSQSCRRAIQCVRRLGARATEIDFAAVRAAVNSGDSLRSVGRQFGIGHVSAKRIAAWPPALAEAVARSVRAQLQAERAIAEASRHA